MQIPKEAFQEHQKQKFKDFVYIGINEPINEGFYIITPNEEKLHKECIKLSLVPMSKLFFSSEDLIEKFSDYKKVIYTHKDSFLIKPTTVYYKFYQEIKKYFDNKDKEVMALSDLGSKDGGLYDKNGNSAHYKDNFVEYIREQELKYGTIGAYFACITQVDRYSQRVGLKDGVDPLKDIIKKRWYIKAAAHFKQKITRYNNGITEMPDQNPYIKLTSEMLNLINMELKLTNIVDKCIKLSNIVNE